MGQTTVKNKRPFGFYMCCITFAFERAAFYAARFLIAIFVAKAVLDGGLGLTEVDGANAIGLLVAFTYLAPIIGGILSDRWLSPRICVLIGMVLMGAGYVVAANATSLATITIVIAIVSIGTGLFKGNVSAINGRLFKDKDQLDSAFSLQYTFVNIGSFIGTSAIGVLYLTVFKKGDVLGFSQSFMVCAITMFVGAIWFLFGFRFLGDAGKKPFKFDAEAIEKKVEKVEIKPLTINEKKRIGAIILVSLFSVIFWLFWYIAYLPIYYTFADTVNWSIGSLAVPQSWFDSLNAFVCIVLGPVLGILWFKLAKSKRGDLNMFAKTALGLIVLGVSYIVLAATEATRGEGLASLWWIVAFGVLISVGEMLFSPLGNSFVSKYAPARFLSLMMGTWIFATFIAGLGQGTVFSFLQKFDFVQAYLVVAAIVIGCGLLLMLFSKKLASLVVEDHHEE